MGFLELLLGWAIVTLLGIASLVAAEPFWARRRPLRPEARVIRLLDDAGAPPPPDPGCAREAA